MPIRSISGNIPAQFGKCFHFIQFTHLLCSVQWRCRSCFLPVSRVVFSFARLARTGLWCQALCSMRPKLGVGSYSSPLAKNNKAWRGTVRATITMVPKKIWVSCKTSLKVSLLSLYRLRSFPHKKPVLHQNIEHMGEIQYIQSRYSRHIF